MKRFLAVLLLLGTTGFGLGQVTRVRADLYTGMSCAP
jgi:hypothetical protein